MILRRQIDGKVSEIVETVLIGEKWKRDGCLPNRLREIAEIELRTSWSEVTLASAPVDPDGLGLVSGVYSYNRLAYPSPLRPFGRLELHFPSLKLPR